MNTGKRPLKEREASKKGAKKWKLLRQKQRLRRKRYFAKKPSRQTVGAGRKAEATIRRDALLEGKAYLVDLDGPHVIRLTDGYIEIYELKDAVKEPGVPS